MCNIWPERNRITARAGGDQQQEHPMDLRSALGGCVGHWTGTNKLWLEPGTPVRESATTAVVGLAMTGAFATLQYSWEDSGQPQEGIIVVLNKAEPGPDDYAWFDTFHTGGKFMMLRGEEVGPARLSALASYPAPEGPDWGWRVVLSSESDDALELRMYNIAPDGTVYPAVEARYRRRSG
jgi:hypothetical protein